MQRQAVAVRHQEPIRALTAIRGVAAWWIVAFHFREALPRGTAVAIVEVINRGYLAVDLFFILSGYVISANYLEWFVGRRFEPARYARFLSLRLSRIYPVHGLVLLLFLVNPLAIWTFSSRRDLADLHWMYYGASILLVQNWGITPGLYWNVPAWSISAEWMAYLTFPVLAVITMVLTDTPARSLLFVASVLITLAAVTYSLNPAGLGHGGQGFWSLRCLLEFTAGLGIGRMIQSKQRSRAATRLALGVAFVSIAAYSLLPIPDYVVMPLAFVAIVFALIDEDGRLATILRSKALQFLGTISYSTYMLHYFVKIWTKFVLVRPGIPSALAFPAYALAVLAGSALLYSVVERPGQHLARRYIARHMAKDYALR